MRYTIEENRYAMAIVDTFCPRHSTSRIHSAATFCVDFREYSPATADEVRAELQEQCDDLNATNTVTREEAEAYITQAKQALIILCEQQARIFGGRESFGDWRSTQIVRFDRLLDFDLNRPFGDARL